MNSPALGREPHFPAPRNSGLSRLTRSGGAPCPAPRRAPSHRGPSDFAREVSGKRPQRGQPSRIGRLGGSARRRGWGGCRRRRARLSGKPKRAELTSMRLKRALSLGASCTPGISAVGRPAGCTRSCRGLPQWDATGSGTQRTPVGGPGEIPAHAKMAGKARPHTRPPRHACAESRPETR